jgi:5-methylcytosine-specific restriction endonuclease McrA
LPLTGDRKREYQREWCAARRAEYFFDKFCVRCGTTENLRLDHIDPTQKVSHRIWSWSAARREAELAKCQVLCDPCHKDKGREQLMITNGYELTPHGNYNRYKRGCRCDPCVASVAPWWRDYRVRASLSPVE